MNENNKFKKTFIWRKGVRTIFTCDNIVLMWYLGRHLGWMSGPHGSRFAGTFMMTVSQDDEPDTISNMAQRLSRVHGLRMTPRHHTQQAQSIHLSHPQGVSQPPVPAVIQNLLGPESSSDGLQFSSSKFWNKTLSSESLRRIARRVRNGKIDI